MTARFNEDIVELATVAWFEAMDYQVLHGPDIAPGERDQERSSYEEADAYIFNGGSTESLYDAVRSWFQR